MTHRAEGASRRVPVAAPQHPQHLPARTAVAVAGLVAVAVGVALVVNLSSSSSEPVLGSGVAATQVRHLPTFTGVELAATNNVSIHVGRPQRVVVHADENLLPLVTTRVANGHLVIGASSGFTTKRPMRVEVTLPALDTISLAGGGVIRATGSVPRLETTLRGSGDLRLAGLIAKHVHAVLSGSGRIDVTATHSLDALLSGMGSILYGGNPTKVTKKVTGGGAVVPR